MAYPSSSSAETCWDEEEEEKRRVLALVGGTAPAAAALGRQLVLGLGHRSELLLLAGGRTNAETDAPAAAATASARSATPLLGRLMAWLGARSAACVVSQA